MASLIVVGEKLLYLNNQQPDGQPYCGGRKTFVPGSPKAQSSRLLLWEKNLFTWITNSPMVSPQSPILTLVVVGEKPFYVDNQQPDGQPYCGGRKTFVPG
ncbi:LOW QUALITY PROTEIN: hypothetical protein PoB_005277200 [Plakobranchus ocellatus]|uniref:Uncharacterized protein n=1 Tax=Plakobranchus ocellatus TaxID=259542 RepID=A0AAV4C4P1_9GAST|nr:LOW QUALITY PROTEIN: hypothetical protein PoB_005277200 [Plakobranchus ocellatus]